MSASRSTKKGEVVQPYCLLPNPLCGRLLASGSQAAGCLRSVVSSSLPQDGSHSGEAGMGVDPGWPCPTESMNYGHPETGECLQDAGDFPEPHPTPPKSSSDSAWHLLNSLLSRPLCTSNSTCHTSTVVIGVFTCTNTRTPGPGQGLCMGSLNHASMVGAPPPTHTFPTGQGTGQRD